MKKSALLFIVLVLLSCTDSDTEQFASGQSSPPTQSDQEVIVTDVFGRQYPSLDPSVIYCGPGWGTKMCHFLHKYDGTIWADRNNYYSEFSDIKFTNFWDPYFISFFSLDSTTSICEGWKLGESNSNGKKWNIKIKKDQEDTFWFDYEYYGSSQEIEYTTTYKYKVVDGLLKFSSTDGQTFTFHPSDKNYSEEFIDADEIVRLDGCQFF